MDARFLAFVARQAAGGAGNTRAFSAEDEARGPDLIDLIQTGTAELVGPDDLLGAKEAAMLLGVDKTTVARWRRAEYMPPPFKLLGGGPIWLRHTLELFRDEHHQVADGAGRRPHGSARPA